MSGALPKLSQHELYAVYVCPQVVCLCLNHVLLKSQTNIKIAVLFTFTHVPTASPCMRCTCIVLEVVTISTFTSVTWSQPRLPQF